MKPYYETIAGSIFCGDALGVLKSMDDCSVQCCITSPPYWGLRDYGNDSQLGLEKTPEEYVGKMVEVFRAVRRVLKDNGTVWLNLGDSYAGNCSRSSTGRQGMGDEREGIFTKTGYGLKPKDLVGIPWRVAFALQSDGWYLRQDIIWHKPNPMPESVTDRCTKSHEYIFLLSKNAKYYYNNEAIKEPVKEVSLKRSEYGWNSDRPSTKNASMGGNGIHTEKMGTRFVNPNGRNKRSVWTVTTKPYKEAHFATYPIALIEPCILAGTDKGDTILDPFFGAGTTGVAAYKHDRKFVGIELNPEYCEIAKQRIEQELSQKKLPGF